MNARAPLTIALRRLPHAEDLPLPAYATEGSAGLDLAAALAEGETRVLAPGAMDALPTGLALALPQGFEAQIRPRSGLARRHGVTIVNAPGTIDADYRGEIEVLLVNLGAEPVTFRRGDRIAQMVVAPVTRVRWDEVDALPASGRGAGGFGSTGLGALPEAG